MIHDFIFTLAQAAPAASPAGGNGGSPLTTFVMLPCIIVIFYYLLIRPQNQKQKQLQAIVASIKTGDKVVTSGGMHGLVANVKDNTVLLKVADNVKIEVDKTAITVVSKRDDDSTAAAAS